MLCRLLNPEATNAVNSEVETEWILNIVDTAEESPGQQGSRKSCSIYWGKVNRNPMFVRWWACCCCLTRAISLPGDFLCDNRLETGLCDCFLDDSFMSGTKTCLWHGYLVKGRGVPLSTLNPMFLRSWYQISAVQCTYKSQRLGGYELQT